MLRNRLIQLVVNNHQHPTTCLASPIIFSRKYSPSERPPMTPQQQRKYPQVEQIITDEGFPLLKLSPRPRNIFNPRPKLRRQRSNVLFKVREQTMREDQDWPSVWPTAKTFTPSAVPLPLRQSYETKPYAVPRGKYANTELLKITNFLHLTPDAIRRHCVAIRKFCTEWPENLDTDDEIRAHFPVTIVTRDYCHSSPNIRDLKARKVELKVNINDLKLEGRDRIKMIELLDHRYDPKTDTLTITTDACPMKIQNQEYAEYLLSAVYFESQEHQDWEDERLDTQAIHRIDLDEYRKNVEKKLGIS